MTITLHHLERSRSHRILWLLEELGLDYELKVYQRDPKTMRADPALRELHPLGKSPQLEVDGRIMAESGAVVEALLDLGDGALRPGADDLQQHRFWLHFAEGSVMPPLLVGLISSQVKNAPVPFFLKPIVRKIGATIDGNYTNAELKRNFRFIDDHLQGREFFVGDALSGADIMMCYPLVAGAERAGLSAESHPNLFGWLDRMKARPAYQRAIDKGGPVEIG